MKKILVLISFLWASAVFAADPIYTRLFSSTAISGYDAVSYFTQKAPVEGVKKYSMRYKGANWYFSTPENLQLFTQSPEQYAPQYGGYCAWAVSEKNDLVSGDPLRWNIVDGKLYLNYDQDIQVKWQKNIPEFISKADKAWPVLLTQ